MYPGDPDGEMDEIANCRCVLDMDALTEDQE